MAALVFWNSVRDTNTGNRTASGWMQRAERYTAFPGKHEVKRLLAHDGAGVGVLQWYGHI